MEVSLERIMTAGIFIGHRTRDWNPKRASYTYGVRNGRHLIDLVITLRQLREARIFLRGVRQDGGEILFVGTKRQAAQTIKEVAQASGSFFVRERWLGGLLTNWRTVQTSLLQLHRLEREQKEGEWTHLPKKDRSLLQKRLKRLDRYLGGVKGIRTLPGRGRRGWSNNRAYRYPRMSKIGNPNYL